MKSTTTYEMHNYAANSAPTLDRSDANANESSAAVVNSGCEKYSLRQRQKRRAAAIAATESLTAESRNYLSDDNNNDNSEPDYRGEPPCDAVTATTATAEASARAKSKSSIGTRKRAGDVISSNSSRACQPSATPTTKAKTKAAPLSKYRRKTANARERTRMREINSAFENLRHCVPHSITGDDAAQSNEKLTKITTLRLAMKYIRILSEALANPSFEADFLLECKRDGDHRFTTLNWTRAPPAAGDTDYDEDADMNAVSERKEAPKTRSPASRAPTKTSKSGGARSKATKNATPATPPATVTCSSNNTAATPRKAPTKRPSKKQKLQPSVSPHSSSHSSAASTCSSLSTSAYASLSSAATSSPCSSASNSSYLIDSPVNAAYVRNLSHSMSDLSSLILESDGESLHLSDPCGSPANYVGVGVSSATAATLATASASRTAALPLADVFDAYDHSILSATLENPLELSLRLLDSSADSLDFAVAAAAGATLHADQQAPPSCMSPLVTLDPFNAFPDLLHGDFPEHSGLDLFLA